jgi:hypothetical protein
MSWVNGGGITVASNAAVGCTIYEWWWLGNQFVNDFDYGRQISSAFGEIPGQTNNPTENGDKYGGGPSTEDNGSQGSGQGFPLLQRHGSPCLSITTAGNFQATRAIPLEWNPDAFGGGPNNPVIYPDLQIGKNLTLGWSKDNVVRPIALYQTAISSPATMSSVQVEVPSVYLLARFNTYYVYYPFQADSYVVPTCLNSTGRSTQQLVSIPLSSSCFSQPGAPVDGFSYGPIAVILSSGTSSSSPAMAIYSNSPNASVVIYDNSQGPEGDQYGSNFAKGSILFAGPVPAAPANNPWTFSSWIITDTLANVQNDVNLLFSWGVTSQ